MRKKWAIPFVVTAFYALMAVSCSLDGRLDMTVTQTNVVGSDFNYTNVYTLIQIGTYTNVSIITQTVTITNDGYVIQGNFYITNVYNEDLVQPTFRVAGTMDGDLVEYVSNGYGSLTVAVTNSAYSGPGKVWEEAGLKKWEAVVFDHTNYSYIFLSLNAALSGFGSYTLSLNFRVSNIPACVLDEEYSGIVTNVSTLEIGGNASVASPDTIYRVYLSQISGAVTNPLPGSYSSSVGTGWTNSVTNCRWLYENIALANGANTFYGYAVSDKGISNAIPAFTITRALIGVDGLPDANWSAAPVMGDSATAGYNGYRLGRLLMTNDSQNLYFWVDAANVPDLGVGDYNGPRISIVLDTNSAAGYTNDAWGGTYVYTPANGLKPDYQLQFRIQQGGGQALYAATNTNGVWFWKNVANNWSGSMQGIQMAVVRTNGFEIGVPLSLLNLSAGATVRALVVLSGADGDNGNKQAWDVVPDSVSNQTISNENQFVTTEAVWCDPYTVQ